MKRIKEVFKKITIFLKKMNEYRRVNPFIYKILITFIVYTYINNLHKEIINILPIGEYGDTTYKAIILSILGGIILLPLILDKMFAIFALGMYTVYFYGQIIYSRGFGQFIKITSALQLFEEAKGVKSSAFEFLTDADEKVFWNFALVVILTVVVGAKTNNKYIKISYPIIHTVLGFYLLTLVKPNYESFFNLIEEEKNSKDSFLYMETDHFFYMETTSSIAFVEKFGLENYLVKDYLDTYIYKLEDKAIENAIIISEFLGEVEAPTDNQYTGIFKGKSLLLIEAESLSHVVIDKELTPTLYKLKMEGINFENYKSALMVGSTSDAEYMVNTGLVAPQNGNIAFQVYADNTYPTTLANKFLDLDYRVSAYHNNYGLYYNRKNMMPALGYERFFDSYELGIESTASDKMMFDIAQWIYLLEERFFSYTITYSGHQPYSLDTLDENPDDSMDLVAEYLPLYEIVDQKYPDLSEKMKVYIAKNMNLDRALEELLKTAKMLNKTDDLVIMIYGDHMPKMISAEQIQEASDIMNNGDDNISTPLIIWSNDIEGQTVDTICTNVDVLPTIFNMWDIDYDYQTVLGNDIMDPSNKGFYFDQSGYVYTNDYWLNLYGDGQGVYDGVDESTIDFNAERKYYQQLFKVSTLIAESNYFEEKEKINETE